MAKEDKKVKSQAPAPADDVQDEQVEEEPQNEPAEEVQADVPATDEEKRKALDEGLRKVAALQARLEAQLGQDAENVEVEPAEDEVVLTRTQLDEAFRHDHQHAQPVLLANGDMIKTPLSYQQIRDKYRAKGYAIELSDVVGAIEGKSSDFYKSQKKYENPDSRFDEPDAKFLAGGGQA